MAARILGPAPRPIDDAPTLLDAVDGAKLAVCLVAIILAAVVALSIACLCLGLAP